MDVSGIVLGFDFGRVRIGVATGNTLSKSAQPLKILVAPSNDAKWSQVGKIISEWEPVACVVGVPCHPDGTPHEVTKLALKFARQLQGRFTIPVYVVDERYSSVVVETGREKIDDASAAVILQQWFDEGTPQRLPN